MQVIEAMRWCYQLCVVRRKNIPTLEVPLPCSKGLKRGMVHAVVAEHPGDTKTKPNQTRGTCTDRKCWRGKVFKVTDKFPYVASDRKFQVYSLRTSFGSLFLGPIPPLGGLALKWHKYGTVTTTPNVHEPLWRQTPSKTPLSGKKRGLSWVPKKEGGKGGENQKPDSGLRNQWGGSSQQGGNHRKSQMEVW